MQKCSSRNKVNIFLAIFAGIVIKWNLTNRGGRPSSGGTSPAASREQGSAGGSTLLLPWRSEAGWAMRVREEWEGEEVAMVIYRRWRDPRP